MAHLGSDVAAFVDGQLSDADALSAAEHLSRCAGCDQAVRQQRLLKARMSTQVTPAPPHDLVASLTQLSARPPAMVTRRQRLQASPAVSMGFAVAGASLVVLAFAYLVGGKPYGDAVSPNFDELSNDFAATSQTMAVNLAATGPDELSAKGWACDEKLGELRLRFAGIRRSDGVIVINYGEGQRQLRLYEQPGSLDRRALTGFTSTALGQQRVWRRGGDPVLLAWDRNGIVYTAATNVEGEALERALADLPSYAPDGPVNRVGNGLQRMVNWAALS